MASDLLLTGCFVLLNRHLLNLKVSEASADSPTNAHNSDDSEGLEGNAEDARRLQKG